MNRSDSPVVLALISHLAPALLALYLVSNLHVQAFTDIWMFIGWIALCSAVILTGISKGNVWVFRSLVGLLLFHTLAIPSSLIWGNGNWELTAGVVLWMAPALLIYLANNPAQVFLWLIPAWLLHAGMIIWKGVTNWGTVDDIIVFYGFPSGLSGNTNLAAGFLALGVVYLLTTPLKWLSVPLLVALLFTGSRWGLIVVTAVIVSMVITRTISWKPLAAAGATVVASVAFLGLFTPLGYAVAGINSFAGVANAVTVDVGVRLAVPHLPTFLPSGVAEHPGLHNVPLRIAVENGLIAAGIWVLITGWALINHSHNAQRQNNVHRWLLLTLVLLSVLDYYTWMGHLGAFWWLLIGLLCKAPRTQSSP